MRKAFIAFVLTVSFAATSLLFSSVQADSSVWEPQKGDYYVVDLNDNIGYLVREDNRAYYKFQAITGQQRYVWYLGKGYFAATPERTWEARAVEIKGDRVTFGSRGEFLRLFYEGESTPYGIHSHKYADIMFGRDNRYQSMGCIIVRDNFLDVIQQTYELNGNSLTVITTKHIDSFPFLN